MKNETIVKDVTARIALDSASKDVDGKREELNRMVGSSVYSEKQVRYQVDDLFAARRREEAAATGWKKIPLARRQQARSIADAAFAYAKGLLFHGGDYSGYVVRVCRWGALPSASTSVSRGEAYSKTCKFRKNDVTHTIVIAPDGVVRLMAEPHIRELSILEGLPLIALYDDDSAVWIRCRNKAIYNEKGWIVCDGDMCFHSTVSREHAVKGLARKIAAHKRAEAKLIKEKTTARRARLVARLCEGVTASIKDAKRLSYCDPGIAAFQARYGIGDEATLPDLVRTGNPQAVALALDVARRFITKNKKSKNEARA